MIYNDLFCWFLKFCGNMQLTLRLRRFRRKRQSFNWAGENLSVWRMLEVMLKYWHFSDFRKLLPQDPLFERDDSFFHPQLHAQSSHRWAQSSGSQVFQRNTTTAQLLHKTKQKLLWLPISQQQTVWKQSSTNATTWYPLTYPRACLVPSLPKTVSVQLILD